MCGLNAGGISNVHPNSDELSRKLTESLSRALERILIAAGHHDAKTAAEQAPAGLQAHAAVRARHDRY